MPGRVLVFIDRMWILCMCFAVKMY
jgi:hypothetical protein